MFKTIALTALLLVTTNSVAAEQVALTNDSVIKPCSTLDCELSDVRINFVSSVKDGVMTIMVLNSSYVYLVCNKAAAYENVVVLLPGGEDGEC